MSSNKTPNLNLPQYKGTDKFDLKEINDSYSIIDNAYKEVIDIKDEITKTNATAEVINARGGKETLGKRLDEFGSQLDNKTNSSIFWEPPIQTNEYANSTLKSDAFKSKFFDKYVERYPHYVKKNLLGKDQSGQFDIHEYVFEPKDYEQTIILTTGIHGSEVVPNFGIAKLIEYVVENNHMHEGLSYMRNKTKIVLIPILNPWGFNQTPRKYANVNGVNPLRNFDDGWDYLIESDEWNMKGSKPFSEAETKILRDVLIREKDNASFYMDFHTGEGWGYDQFIYFLNEDNYLRPTILNTVNWLDDRCRKKYNREPVNEVKETNRAKSLFYAQRQLGIPSACCEYGTGRYGGQNTGTEDLTHYLCIAFNYIWNGLRANIRKSINDKKNINNVSNLFLSDNTYSGYSDIINREWKYNDLISKVYEKLRNENQDYIQKTVLGKDSSGLYDILKYELIPKSYNKTVFLCAGLRGTNFKAVLNLANLFINLVNSDNEHILKIRNNTKFIIIPCANPWGYSQEVRVDENSLGQNLFSNFSNNQSIESVLLRKEIDDNNCEVYINLLSYYNSNKPSYFNDLTLINKLDGINSNNIISLNALLKKYYKYEFDSGIYTNYLNDTNDLVSYLLFKNKNSFSISFISNILKKVSTDEYNDLGVEPKEMNLCLEYIINIILTLSVDNLKPNNFKKYYKADDDSLSVSSSWAEIPQTNYVFEANTDCICYLNASITIREDSDNAINWVGFYVKDGKGTTIINNEVTNMFASGNINNNINISLSNYFTVTKGEKYTIKLLAHTNGNSNVRRCLTSYVFI